MVQEGVKAPIAQDYVNKVGKCYVPHSVLKRSRWCAAVWSRC